MSSSRGDRCLSARQLVDRHRREVVAVRERRDGARRPAVVDERPVQQEDEEARRQREVLEDPRRFREPGRRCLRVPVERRRRRVRGEGEVDDLDDEHLIREVYEIAARWIMRHGPNKHGKHAHEQAHSDGEIRLSVLDAAARAEVILPSIIVGR